MRLNQKVRYGVGCLYELSKTPSDYVDGDHIAARQAIPRSYAHKVLQLLANAGLIHAQRGAGYKIARPLADITALEIVEVLTVEPDAGKASPDLGLLLERRIDEALAGFTLGELLTRSDTRKAA